MPKRSFGLSLLAGLAIVVSACTSGATQSPSAAASASAAVSPSAAASPSPSPSPSNLKIGVVTDVGTVNDKNFNEYTYKGAQAGAKDLGIAGDVPVVVPKDASEYAKLIQSFVDQKFDIIVTVGFNLGQDTTKAAKANPTVKFLGIDQSPICVDANGVLDTTFKCAGKAADLLPNYISLTYQEDQAGYLAGIIAASLSQNGVIGAIGGITLCAPCIRYIQGYELGAKSVNPNIQVKSAYITKSDFVKAFNDPVTGKNFGQQFIQQNKPDVLFQVAGKTGNGILDAACDANILGIGVDVDQALSYPNAAKCTVTSAEKHLAVSVEQTLVAMANGTAKPGDNLWNAANDGIGVSPGHDLASKITADIQKKVDDALAAMKAGTLKTCPDKCGVYTGS